MSSRAMQYKKMLIHVCVNMYYLVTRVRVTLGTCVNGGRNDKADFDKCDTG